LTLAEGSGLDSFQTSAPAELALSEDARSFRNQIPPPRRLLAVIALYSSGR
jgi:hypothetical protein